MIEAGWLKALSTLLTALWAALKELKPYLVGAALQKLRMDLHQARINAAIEKSNADEIRHNFEEYERYRTLLAGDNDAWLRERVAKGKQSAV
jgi:hypothetical protein